MRASTALAIVALSALVSCTPRKRLASVSGPVRVEFAKVRRLDVGGGHLALPYLAAGGQLEIHTEPRVDVAVGCYEPQPELQEDAEGTRVAYRCSPGSPWRVVYFHAGHAVEDCGGEHGAGAQVSWARVPGFDAAVAGLVRCRAHEAFALARSYRGDAGVADALIASRAVSFNDRYGGDSSEAWEATMRALPPPERARVAAQLAPALRTPGSPAPLLWRALLFTDVDDPALADALAARANELLASPDALEGYRGIVLSALVRLVARARPDLGGELGCRTLARSSFDDLHATLAVARGGGRCEALASPRSQVDCESSPGCPVGGTDGGAKRACSDEDLRAWVDAQLALPAAEAARPLQTDQADRDRARLAAAVAGGRLSAAARREIARAHYAVDQPASPDCLDVDRPGVSCGCFGEDTPGGTRPGCAVALDAGSGANSVCSFRVDHERGRVYDVRSVCVPRGERCNGQAVCCGRAACVSADGGAFFCVGR